MNANGLAVSVRGLRKNYGRGAAVSMEPGHSWQLGETALVLSVWVVAGLVLCLTTFRWQNRRDR